MSHHPQSSAGVPIVPVSDDIIADDTTTQGFPPPKVLAKVNFDSGFVSSTTGGFASDYASGPVSGVVVDTPPPQQSPATTTTAAIVYADSGLCDEDTAVDSGSIMHVDKKSGAKEWTCSGAITDVRNNLGKSTRPPRPMRYENPMVMKEYMSLWKVCYIQDENGDTQLHLSILSKMSKAIVNIIRLAPQNLLLDLRNDDGQVGMHYAVLTNQTAVIRQLRAAGAKPSVRDHSGNTPLHLACINNNMDCVRALTTPITADELKMFPYAERIPLLPADTLLNNYDGETCVHIVARRGRIDMLRYLVLVCGADVNAREGRSGYTALHIACENENNDLIDFLLTECKDLLQLETCTYSRRTAYQFAVIMSDQRTMEALRRCGAEPIEPLSESDVDSADEDEDEDDDDDDMMADDVVPDVDDSVYMADASNSADDTMTAACG